MPPTLDTCVPASLRAGTTWAWLATLPDYPIADGWGLSYAIRGASALAWQAGWATNDGTTWTILIPAADTANLVAGSYAWVAYAAKGAEKYVAASGTLRVLANLETAAAGDQQSHAETMVALIEAELERRLTGAAAGGSAGIESYQIGGRAITRFSTTELRKLLGEYRAELQAMLRAASGTWPAPTRIRFQPVSGGMGGCR